MSDAGALSSLIVDEQDRDPLEDIAIGPAWLRQVARDHSGPCLRVYRPRPAVAFSGKDCLEEGIARAARVSLESSFLPVRRGVGGRAVAYHHGSIGMDHIGLAVHASSDIRGRFSLFGNAIAQALQSVGVPARVGPVPGEYCPGEFSVNDGRGHKLVGTAQRLVRGAWLFTSTILVADSARIRRVLDLVYPELALEWNPESVGSVEDLIPGIALQDVQQAVLTAYADFLGSELVGVPDSVVRAASDARSQHELPAPPTAAGPQAGVDAAGGRR